MLKFKKKYSVQQMAKSTGIEALVNFCEVVESLDQFEKPDYRLLRKVLKNENYDTSMIVTKSKSIPFFPVKKMVNIKNKLTGAC